MNAVVKAPYQVDLHSRTRFSIRPASGAHAGWFAVMESVPTRRGRKKAQRVVALCRDYGAAAVLAGVRS